MEIDQFNNVIRLLNKHKPNVKILKLEQEINEVGNTYWIVYFENDGEFFEIKYQNLIKAKAKFQESVSSTKIKIKTIVVSIEVNGYCWKVKYDIPQNELQNN